MPLFSFVLGKEGEGLRNQYSDVHTWKERQRETERERENLKATVKLSASHKFKIDFAPSWFVKKSTHGYGQ